MLYLLIFFKFLLFYILFSRAISIPVGIGLGINKYFLFLLVFFLDLLQIPLYYYIFEHGISRLKIFQFLKNRLPKQERVEKSFIRKIVNSLGSIGIILISAFPAFGGMATAVFIARTLKIKKTRSIIYLAVGSFLGCLIVFGGVQGIVFLVKRIFKY